MDHARCAALYNYLVDYCLAADGATPATTSPSTYLTTHSHPDVRGGVSGDGLIYHQRRHLAVFLVHPDDTEHAYHVDDHHDSWKPLETILSNWIALIRLGKVVASARDEPHPSPYDGAVKVGNWEWWADDDGQMAECVTAGNQLCEAIEARPLYPRTHRYILQSRSRGGRS
ncbi:hypothetical protein CPLU01_06482 [Colletotrichum plurivorum]|uniref:Uncharacterized protein n=1 Tax=Colletotrichum plurivorum TaxID=2175906 RepID=A0A8H6NGQ3_9PEZI|nr:hypothetical protein CPLU01_06482 [Colletotrichum plurivorum]